MLATFLSASGDLLHASVWVFLAVVPLIWFDDRLKRRRIADVSASGQTGREAGGTALS